ncbi:hypothetical protein LBMAG48_16320 [Phycisphaerae bacterium]|jgi:hypothetical protein|nr:hypothetical protein LBMAG48_16320 [Phycisphaerae bacterium]
MPAANVRMMCPNLVCRKVLAVPESVRGKTVRCKACGTNIRVPAKDAGHAPAANGKKKDAA